MLDIDRDALVAYRCAHRRTADGVRPIPGTDHRSAGRALAALIERYRPLVRAVRAAQFSDLRDEDAEDILTDALLDRAWSVNLDGKSLSPWLRTVVRNGLTDIVRSARFRHEHSTDFTNEEPMVDEEQNLLVAVLTRTLVVLAADEDDDDLLVRAALEGTILPALSGQNPYTRNDLAEVFELSDWRARKLHARATELAAAASREVLAPRI